MTTDQKEETMTIVTGDSKKTGGRSNAEHHDGEGLDGIRARRNLLAGYWAGSLIGFVGDDLGRYARDLHEVDHAVAGDPHREGRGGVEDQQLVEVEGTVQVLLGRGREASRHRGQRKRHPRSRARLNRIY